MEFWLNFNPAAARGSTGSGFPCGQAGTGWSGMQPASSSISNQILRSFNLQTVRRSPIWNSRRSITSGSVHKRRRYTVRSPNHGPSDDKVRMLIYMQQEGEIAFQLRSLAHLEFIGGS